MRDITQLHPALQVLANKLMTECALKGIKIKIGECVRTVAEQDALYAKGRTAPGGKVTNAKGSTYSSMHQWGVAFDFFLDMDVDKDGTKSDDAFNNSTSLFDKVGAIGQSIGLEWGGAWKSIIDRPHFQLPYWGSTASKLKKEFGTPDVFKKTWYPSGKAVSIKSSKEDIIWLQTQLTKCVKDYTIKVDGSYGAKTRLAVLHYWDQLGWGKHMKDDGTKAGTSTIQALASYRKE